MDDFAVTVLAIDGLLGGDRVPESAVQTAAKGETDLLRARAGRPREDAAPAPAAPTAADVVATASPHPAPTGDDQSRIANAAVVKDIIRWYYDMQLDFARAELPLRMHKAGVQASAVLTHPAPVQ